MSRRTLFSRQRYFPLSMKGNTRLHLRISRHNIFTRFPLLFNYSERSCIYTYTHIRRKRKLLLLFINVVSHFRSFFLLVRYRALPRFHRFICIVLRFVVAFDYCTRAFMTRPRANAFYVFLLLCSLRGLSVRHFRGKYSETFLLTLFATVPRLQPRISYPSIAISPSTSRIIYVVCRIFSQSECKLAE